MIFIPNTWKSKDKKSKSPTEDKKEPAKSFTTWSATSILKTLRGHRK